MLRRWLTLVLLVAGLTFLAVAAVSYLSLSTDPAVAEEQPGVTLEGSQRRPRRPVRLTGEEQLVVPHSRRRPDQMLRAELSLRSEALQPHRTAAGHQRAGMDGDADQPGAVQRSTPPVPRGRRVPRDGPDWPWDRRGRLRRTGARGKANAAFSRTGVHSAPGFRGLHPGLYSGSPHRGSTGRGV